MLPVVPRRELWLGRAASLLERVEWRRAPLLERLELRRAPLLERVVLPLERAESRLG